MNIIKDLGKLLDGLNDCIEDILNKRLFESFNLGSRFCSFWRSPMVLFIFEDVFSDVHQILTWCQV